MWEAIRLQTDLGDHGIALEEAHMTIVWGVAPPPRLPHSYVRLLCVKAGERVAICRLGPVIGLLTHWTGTKTVACQGVQCHCHDKPQTWKGYVAGLTVAGLGEDKRPSWRRTVIVITPEIAVDVGALRIGQTAIICRMGKRSNSPLAIEECKLPPVDPLPEAFDPQPYVLRAMGHAPDSARFLKVCV